MSNNILVIGDSCTDKYIYGSCERLCPEAPVPVFTPLYEIEYGGMAQNVYNNLLQLTEKCDIITNSNPSTKTRIVDNRTNQMIVRIDEPDNIKLANITDVDFKEYDVVIVSDYYKGFIKSRRIEWKQGKRKRVSYRCDICSKLYPLPNMQVDHIVPIGKGVYNDIEDAKRFYSFVYCSWDNLQHACKQCHKEKTKRENKSPSFHNAIF